MNATTLPTWWVLAALLSGIPGFPGSVREGMAATTEAAGPAETDWFDWRPAEAGVLPGSALDMRALNERYAGEHGRIAARDGRFVHAGTGEPVRFWAVNGPPGDLEGPALAACARMLAGRGVNLVRVHGSVFDEKTGEFRPEKVSHLARVVEAMKAEGIYTHLSIYFPLWFKPQAGLSWLEGYDGSQHPFAALLFNPGFRRQWEGWWKAVLNAKIGTGVRLADEPALFGVEIQNEDSFFFWTFAPNRLPEAQWTLLERQFGDWLRRKYGTIEAALEAWGRAGHPRDRPADGRVGFRSLWEMTNQRTPRDRDTVAFLFETQTEFYRRAVKFFREAGFAGLVTPSNWTTASAEVLGPLEKLSYTEGDFVDRHGYFGCLHKGPNSEWSIRDGHTYVDRSALRFDAEEPGRPAQFNHPVIDIEYEGRPSMISETTWTRPNRYRPEAPLFYAVYGALQDTDAIVHFALDGDQWSVKPRFWMQPWTLMAPSQMGQFPAAALIYRRGLVRSGEVLAEVNLDPADLLALKGTPLPQDAAFDELRLKDVPAGMEVRPGQRIDPLVHFAGRTQVRFREGGSRTRLADLRPWVDRAGRTVRSSSGELVLDYGKGVLRIDAPAVQGVSGKVTAADGVRLRDLIVESPMDQLHVVAVSLDGEPLGRSNRVLVQAMSEERNHGWRVTREGESNRIASIGRDPWQVRKIRGRVRLLRSDAADLKVTALDPTGRPLRAVGSAADLELEPEVVHYLIESRP